MPHDVNGQILKAGDKVTIPGTVVEVFEGDDYCNCTVELTHSMPPKMTITVLSAINTSQLEKAGLPETAG